MRNKPPLFGERGLPLGGSGVEALLRTQFGIEAEGLEPLGGGRVNRLWRYGQWVVKQYDHKVVPRERAEQVVRWQAEMAARGLPVPAPAVARSGALWAESEESMLVVMDFAAGERRTRGSLNAGEAANLGEALGRLHGALRTAGSAGMAPPGPPDLRAALQRWGELREQALARPQPDPFDRLVVAMADHLAEAIPGLPPLDWAAQPWQLCHGDLHLDNLLFDPAGQVAAILDFDNARPWWPGMELLMAWNLCLCADPGEPSLTPQAGAFFAAYRAAHPIPLEGLPRLYWATLVANTWPASVRYRQGGPCKPDWVEILGLRLRAARWLHTHGQRMSNWMETPHRP